MSKVRVINAKTGAVGYVEQHEVAGALQQGWRLETDEEITQRIIDEEYGSSAGEAIAGIAGTLSGASFGATDVLAKLAGKGDQLKQYYDSNPTANIAGQVAGGVVPLLFTGGTGTAAKIAAYTPAAKAVKTGATVGEAATNVIRRALAKRLSAKSAEGVAKVGGRLAQGGVEGALFSTGHLVSEAALGETDLTSEKIMATLGVGAILGGGVTAVLPSLVGGVKNTTKFFAKKLKNPLNEAVEDSAKAVEADGLIADFFRKMADTNALKTIGLKKGGFKGLIKKGYDLNDVAKTMREYVIQTGEYAGKPLLRVMDGADTIISKLHHAKSEIGAQLGKFYNEIDDILARAPSENSKISTGAILEDLQTELQSISKGAFGSQKASIKETMRTEVMSFLREIDSANGSFGKTLELRKNLDDLIGDAFNDKAPKQKIKLLKAFRRSVVKEMLKKGEIAGEMLGKPELVKELLESQRLYRNFYHLGEMAEQELGSMAGNRFFGLTDHMVGLAGAMSGGGGTHLGKGVNAGQIVNVHSANPLYGLGAAVANKVMREKGPIVSLKLAEAAGSLAHLEKKLMTADSRITKGIKAFLDTTKPAPLSSLASASTIKSIGSFGFGEAKTTRKTFENARDGINKMVSNPKHMLANIAHSLEPMAGAAPQLTRAMVMKSSNGLLFLHDKMPKPKQKTSLTPLLEDDNISEVDIQKWARYVKAVNDPLSLIDDIKANRVTKEAVEAVKIVYPELFQDIQQRIVYLANEQQRKLTYHQKANLSVLFDLQLHDSLAPEFIGFTQQMAAQQPEEGQNTGQGQQKLKKTGLNKLTYAEAARSEAQTIRSK